MSLQGVVGPNGSYTPPNSGSLTAVSSDIAILQTNYNNSLAAVNSNTTQYANLYQQLQNAITAYEQALTTNSPDSASDLTTLQSCLSTFTTDATSYESAVQTLQLAAQELTNANDSYQQLQDSQINTSLNGFVTSLSGKIDGTLYSELQASNSTRQGARSTLLSALTNFQDNESLLASARALLSQQQTTAISDNATALINEGLEPTSPASNSDWAQYETDVTAVNQTQASITTYLTNRTTYSATLSSAIAAYQDAYDNTTTGFVPLLQQAATQANSNVTTYLTQIASAKTLVDNAMTTSLSQRQAADALAQQQHYAAYPSTDPNLTTVEQNANSTVINTIDDIVSRGVATTGTDLSLPVLPGVGQHISMLDFMKFLTAGQLIAKQIALQSQQSDTGLNGLRLDIWKTILTASSTQFSEEATYVQQLTAADTLYNSHVDSDNDTTQINEQSDVSTYNAEVSAINSGLALINTQNQQLTANGNEVTDDLNYSAQQSVNTINETNAVEPNSINTLDLFNQTATVNPPTPLSNPTPIPYPTAYPQFQNVPQLPSPIPTIASSQASIDSFNALVTQINDTVGPLSSELNSIQTPPINFQQLTPLFYRQDVPIRSLSAVFDFTSITQSLSSLFDLVDKANTPSVLKNINQNQLIAFASSKMTQSKGQTIQGAGGAVSLSAVNANIDPAQLGQLFNQLIQSEQYGSLVKAVAEEATLVAGIQTGVRPPTRNKDYSVFGVMRDELTTEAAQAKDSETNEQLKAVAEQLIYQSGNVKELEQNANLIIAKSGLITTLSDDDLKKLQASLVFVQKVTLLMLAGIALGSIGAQNDPERAAANFISLTQSPEAAAATPKSVALTGGAATGSGVSQTQLPGIPSELIQALQAAGLTSQVARELATLIQAGLSPAGIIASLPGGKGTFNQIILDLQKAGFRLPQDLQSPDNPDFIKALFNEIDRKIALTKKEQLQEQVSAVLSSLGVPQEAVNVFNGLSKSGSGLGAAVNEALAQARAPSPLPTTLEALGLGKVTSAQLSQLLQASFSQIGIVAALPNGRAQFDQIVGVLQKNGFTLPTELNPESPDFIKTLLDQLGQKLPAAARADLAKHTALFLRSLNLPEASVANFKASIASGAAIGSAAVGALNGVVGALIGNLNVNLQALPDNVRLKLEAQANTTLASLKNLSPSDKLSLSLAIGAGLVTQEAGKGIAQSLGDIATLGSTPKTISKAISSFEKAHGRTEQREHGVTATTTTTVLGGDPTESRHPSTMPKDTVTLFHERFSHLTVDENDRRYLEQVTADFGRTVITQHDFYQFSINFLLDPAKSILKNFSMITAEQGSGGHIPPDQMRIAS